METSSQHQGPFSRHEFLSIGYYGFEAGVASFVDISYSCLLYTGWFLLTRNQQRSTEITETWVGY